MWHRLAWAGMLVLAGCASQAPVPVIERGAPPAAKSAAAAEASREGFYTVKKGDTLYRIALDHGQDYKDVAAWNNLENAAKIEVGQQLRVAPPESVAVAKPLAAPERVVVVGDARPAGTNTEALKREPRGGKVAYSPEALAQARAMDGAPARADEARPADKPAAASAPVPAALGDDAVDWVWPVAGKVLTQFVEGGPGKESNKGIDLTGRTGEPIQAAAAGKVTYVGSLRGYGDFLVLRHNATYLSVYAHNSRILVKEGQSVTKGQKIAEVGSSDAEQPKLHFEIRRLGKPVDPLKFLPSRESK